MVMGGIPGKELKVYEAERIRQLPPYLFAQIDRIIEEKTRQGVSLVNFGIGDPDLPTPDHIVERLRVEASRPENHRYPSYQGMRAFREAAASWFSRHFGIEVDPEREVLTLIGSKEGIAHLPWALLDPGDVALVPDPAYPVYRAATILAGGEPYPVPLLEERGFLPDLRTIPEETWRRAKLFFINYPNNPTSATADLEFYRELVEWCQRYDVLIAGDMAYCELVYEGEPAPSILQVPGAKERTLEFFSLSKTYNMTGWRIGFAVGGEGLVSALGKIKTNIDSGVFNAVQYAGIEALEGPQDCVMQNRETYIRRRDALQACFDRLGWQYFPCRATLYIWVKAPDGMSSAEFATQLLDRAGVVTAPGAAYGEHGEGYVRFSLSLPDRELEEGISRLEREFGSR
ncbi:MAG: LL-diaminopimelate aminotransferase [Candidatus Geothermincolales bacterium]